jgi:release factor glutamine methyltransferase
MAEPADQPWTIGRLLTWTTDYLKQHNSDSPRLEAEILLAHARKCPRISLYTAFNEECEEPTRIKFREMVKRRAAGEPVAYLVGHKEFYSLSFQVDQRVLIPRPETELIVVRLLDHAKQQQGRTLRIVDVGTGSGILAICAALHLADAEVTAIDVSPEALEVARANAEAHGVAARLQWVQSDLLSKLPEEPCVEVIISNPPYVSEPEYAELPPDVRDHEPRLALVGGPTGTELIERLVVQAASRLTPGGCLIVEFSPMIASQVKQFVEQQGTFEKIAVEKDTAGHARILSAVRKG